MAAKVRLQPGLERLRLRGESEFTTSVVHKVHSLNRFSIQSELVSCVVAKLFCTTGALYVSMK